MKGGIAAVMLLCACGPRVLDTNIRRLPHPSAGGPLPAHALNSDAGYQISLTKVTNEEICLDAYLTSYSITADRALAEVKKRLKVSNGIGFCRGKSQSTPDFCDRNETFPIKQVFEPVIYAVEFSNEASNSYYKTGNREIVCTQDQRNRRGDVVGCRRYAEQDEEAEQWDAGVLFYARGGWRSCIANSGLIGPTTKEFDFAFRLTPFRVVFEGGKSVNGAWGATGGTSAETPAVSDLAAARAAAEQGSPTVMWVAPTDKHPYGRSPTTTKITTPSLRPTPSPPTSPASPTRPTRPTRPPR